MGAFVVLTHFQLFPPASVSLPPLNNSDFFFLELNSAFSVSHICGFFPRVSMAGKEEQRIMGKLLKDELSEMGILGDDVDSFKRKKVVICTDDGGGKKGSDGGGSGGGGMRCCQAEKCVADLTDAKPYYKRHKVCEHHSKAQIVLVDGIRQRFCQQCSRFHELSEFDDTKRSCRWRLAGHNMRRRKNAGESNAEGGSSHKLEDIVFSQVDDRRRIKITIKENATYKHLQIR